MCNILQTFSVFGFAPSCAEELYVTLGTRAILAALLHCQMLFLAFCVLHHAWLILELLK